MTVQTHSQMANFIWSICNLLRGPYKKERVSKGNFTADCIAPV